MTPSSIKVVLFPVFELSANAEQLLLVIEIVFCFQKYKQDPQQQPDYLHHHPSSAYHHNSSPASHRRTPTDATPPLLPHANSSAYEYDQRQQSTRTYEPSNTTRTYTPRPPSANARSSSSPSSASPNAKKLKEAGDEGQGDEEDDSRRKKKVEYTSDSVEVNRFYECDTILVVAEHFTRAMGQQQQATYREDGSGKG